MSQTERYREQTEAMSHIDGIDLMTWIPNLYMNLKKIHNRSKQVAASIMCDSDLGVPSLIDRDSHQNQRAAQLQQRVQ